MKNIEDRVCIFNIYIFWDEEKWGAECGEILFISCSVHNLLYN